MNYLAQKIIKATALLSTIFFSFCTNAQNINPYPPGTPVNSVRTWNAAAPEQDGNALIARPLKDVKQTTQYIDGLGRPLQTVIKQGSLLTGSTPVDAVSPVVYDELGREQFKYLPFAANNTSGNQSVSDGGFKLNPFQQQQAFMQQQYGTQGETVFYSKTNFEASPLNRVEKAMPPGNSWAGGDRGTAIKYWTNTAADMVPILNVTDVPGSFGNYTRVGMYPAGTLYKNVTVDEHGKQVIEFKDKEERTILKKVQLTAAADDGTGSGYEGWLSTRYIYDDLGNLRCVVQPEAVRQTYGYIQLSSSMLNELCFRYEYDQRNRMIKKKIPGALEVRMVYDSRDRLVLTQDGNMYGSGKWLYTQYDELNRPVATGLWTNNQDISYHAAQASNSTTYPDLSGQVYEELTRTFYDNYNWLPANGNPFAAARNTADDNYFNAAGNTYPYYQSLTQSNAVKGMVTGTKIKVLGTSTYLYSISYYDDKGRVIQSQQQSSSGGTDITTMQYSWAGQLLLSAMHQQKNGTNPQATIVLSKFTYDDLGRLIKTEKKVSNSLVNNGAMPPSFTTTAELAYDALGQLKTKKIGSKAPVAEGPIETLSYDYNIRGWLLGMNRDYAKDANSTNYFGFDLGYDKANNNIIGNQTYANPQYNGNIEGTVWKSKGDGEKRKYDFTYDNASRFLAADFNQYTGGSFNKTAGVDFTEKLTTGFYSEMLYDDNGNIQGLERVGLKFNSSAFIDRLSFISYPLGYVGNSNKIKQVFDGANDINSRLGDFKYDPATKKAMDYVYDANGNIIYDNNRGISKIIYNHLNLPQLIPVTGKGSIEYVYDALGNKLKKIVHENNKPDKTTTYINGMVYEDDVLQFVQQEEGRIRLKALPSGGFGFVYDYFIKDHLGNVRMVLTDEQQIDKYPVASLEPAKIATEKNYYDINDAQVTDKSTATGITDYTNDNGIGNNPSDPPFEAANSTKLYKLNSNDAKTGLGITLKVMAGDKLDVLGKSYYFQNSPGSGSNSAIPVTDILAAFLNAPAAAAVTSVHGAVTPAVINTPTGLAGITNMMNQQGAQSSAAPLKPRAFINVIFFDEQFKSYDYRVSMVGNNNTIKDHFAELKNIAANKNGYAYIYCSNESPVNVFFDNIQVVHTRGPILEETHYYPFGLTMAGISSKASGLLENNMKFNGIEQNNAFDLNMYDAFYRNLDPQIGRFWQLDPKIESAEPWSPYTAMLDNPIRYMDPLGDSVGIEDNSYFDNKTGSFVEQINMTVTGKVVNESSTPYTNEQMQMISERISQSIKSVYSDKSENSTTIVTTDITVASTSNPEIKSDHLFILRDQGNLPDPTRPGKIIAIPDLVGVASPGEKAIYIATNIIANIPASTGVFSGTGKTVNGEATLERTVSHELGHSMYQYGGFGNFTGHPSVGTESGNLMNQSHRDDAGMKITSEQRIQIRNDFYNGKLNIGRQRY